MAVVRPFKGLRPVKDKAEKVASPPYDVISSSEAREMAKDNPYSFLHVVKPEIDLPEGIDLYDERVYQKGKENLERLKNEGVLIKEEKPVFYLYEQRMGDHYQVGLVCVASVDEYEKGIIKKHENTRIEKELDRTKHIETLNAQAGPVFLTYKNQEEIDSFIKEILSKVSPEYDFEVDGVRHTFYVINNDEWINKIVEMFKKIDYLYVADGHHRSAAALRVRNNRREKNPNHTGDEEYNYFLVVIFPHNQMYIMDYNRVVKDLNGRDKEKFMEEIKEKFEIEEAPFSPYKPESKHTFGMYLDGKWYKLKAKEGTYPENDPVESLDVAVLQNNLLNPILGIENPRKDKRIDFVGGIRGLNYLEELVNSGKWAVAFSMYPTSIEDLMAVADAGKVMPPKSTWFEPKLRSGMVVHELD